MESIIICVLGKWSAPRQSNRGTWRSGGAIAHYSPLRQAIEDSSDERSVPDKFKILQTPTTLLKWPTTSRANVLVMASVLVRTVSSQLRHSSFQNACSWEVGKFSRSLSLLDAQTGALVDTSYCGQAPSRSLRTDLLQCLLCGIQTRMEGGVPCIGNKDARPWDD